MAAFTVTAKLKNRVSGKTSTAQSVSYSVNTSSLGWSPPNSTTTDMSNMLATYSSPKVLRLYSGPGGGIQSWTGSLFNTIPRTTTLIYSIKDWPIDVAGWLSSRPADWTTPCYFCLDHEPEQQDSNDPTPAAYKQEWQELIAQLNGHPRRNEIKLTPIYTEWFATHNDETTWWNNFGIVTSWSGVDAVGFDVYDTGYELYRSAQDRNAFGLKIARRTDVNKPLIYGEWGIKRKPYYNSGANYDTDGSICAQAMQTNMDYLRQQADVPVVAWFHRGECVLDQPVTTSALTFTRDIERTKFKDLMAAN